MNSVLSADVPTHATLHRNPSIGAAIIVKNAEHTILDTLESLEELVDHVVVLDTGSTDATRVLATRWGAEVHCHLWEDDFSKARNHALSLIRTDWCLCIDADEQLTSSSFDSIRERMDDPTIGGFRVRIQNALSDDDSTSIDHSFTRIFRALPAIRFRGAIHEQVADSIREAGLRIEESDIILNHDGYRNVDEAKTSRNATLLRKELQERPDDVWTQYHLGLTEFGAGNLKEAYTILYPIRESQFLSLEQQEIATIRCAQCALAEDDFMKVEQLLLQPCMDSEREGLRQYVLGAAYCNKLNFAAGLRCFTMARESQSRLVDQKQLSSIIDQIRQLRLPGSAA